MPVDLSYLITPFICWLIAGSMKFAINSLRRGQPATAHIGYGGFPSNHTTIVSGMAALVGLKEGIDTAAFGVALTLAFIVVIDALDLRNHIGRHARTINALSGDAEEKLRERLGHSVVEVMGGVVVGGVIALGVSIAVNTAY